MLVVSAQTPSTTHDLPLSSTAIESVDLGDCILATVRSSIPRIAMQPLSGPLELLSTVNNVASRTCDITLNSDIAVEITTSTFTCNQTGKCLELLGYSLHKADQWCNVMCG